MTNTELTLDQLQAVAGGVIHPTFVTCPTESRGIILPSDKYDWDETPPELKLAVSRLRPDNRF